MMRQPLIISVMHFDNSFRETYFVNRIIKWTTKLFSDKHDTKLWTKSVVDTMLQNRNINSRQNYETTVMWRLEASWIWNHARVTEHYTSLIIEWRLVYTNVVVYIFFRFSDKLWGNVLLCVNSSLICSSTGYLYFCDALKLLHSENNSVNV